jgi:hypothetical protein
MKPLKRSAIVFVFALVPACGQQLVEFPQADSAQPDIVGADGPSSTDVNPDLGSADTSRGDQDVPDAQAPDTLSAEIPVMDAGAADIENRDGDRIDAPLDELGLVRVDSSDVSIADSRPQDLPFIDASSGEAAPLDASNANPDASMCRLASVVLGAAANFAVLAGSTVTSTGPTLVTGDLGVSPGSSVTGFPPGTIVGALHAADPTAAQAVADLTTAYNDAAGRTLCAVTLSGNIGGQTLTPGLYKSTSSLAISSGDLTLDAQGDAAAVFVFQIASTLTTTSGRQVILSGGAKSSNLFWQVGTSATLGSASVFQGTIMADQAVTLDTGATLNGRVLARIAGVSLDSNTIVTPSP